MPKLSDLKKGEKGKIVDVSSHVMKHQLFYLFHPFLNHLI